MSKLPNAPLLEVIFELTWPVNSREDQEKFQFLLGDIYSKLKSEYPNRQNLVQPSNIEIPLDVFINKPIYRFTKSEPYPLYQIGPGLLSVNTIDSAYFWNEFEKEIIRITKVLSDSYDFDENSILNLGLKYIDFFQFDFNNNALEYLNEYLHLDIKHNLKPNDSNPLFFTFAVGYPCKVGLFNTIINRGGVNNKDGFVIETNVTKQITSSDLPSLSNWLEESHDFLSDKFKTMTEGPMYDSFKKQKI